MKKILGMIIVSGLVLAVIAWYTSHIKHEASKETLSEMDSHLHPSPLLKKALALIQTKHTSPGIAIDFGPGGGTEAKYLLEHGYQVIAIDDFPDFLENTKNQVAGTPYQKKLTTILSKFEELDWASLPKIDLAFASYLLSFPTTDTFLKVWSNIINHLKPGGYFIGTIYRHGLKNEDIVNLFEDFDIEYFDNAYALGDSPSTPEPDDPYSVIARKKS